TFKAGSAHDGLSTRASQTKEVLARDFLQISVHSWALHHGKVLHMPKSTLITGASAGFGRAAPPPEPIQFTSTPSRGLQFANRSHRISAHRSVRRKVACQQRHCSQKRDNGDHGDWIV